MKLCHEVMVVNLLTWMSPQEELFTKSPQFMSLSDIIFLTYYLILLPFITCSMITV